VLGVTEISKRDVFRMPPAPALPTVAVARLPRGEFGVTELDEDPFWRLVAAFLVECRRAQTRRAYFTDLKAWYAWCTARDLHPLAARRHDVALWARHLAEQPQASGKPAAPASIAGGCRACRASTATASRSGCSTTTPSPTSSVPALPQGR
jgi:hypothetical protein